MASLGLTLACGEYDRTRYLIDGTVKAPGIDLRIIPMSDAFDRHDRMLRREEFDLCELSMSSFLMARQRGQAFTAIPTFPYRMFRHGYVLINANSGITTPSDLPGKRVGIAMYQVTTALWVRGFLLHDYGVQPEQIQWYTSMPEVVDMKPPEGVSIEVVPPPRTLEDMLVDGALDALVLIEEVPNDLLQKPGVGRLFPNYRQVEMDYFRRTRIYPIMHTVVVKDAILREHPWVAQSVAQAFEKARELGYQDWRFPRVWSLAWAGSYMEEENQIFGGDPYVYGLEPNRPTLEALVTYSHEQGLTRRQYTVEELFALP